MVREALLKFQSPSIRLWWDRTAAVSEFQQICLSQGVSQGVREGGRESVSHMQAYRSQTQRVWDKNSPDWLGLNSQIVGTKIKITVLTEFLVSDPGTASYPVCLADILIRYHLIQ